jgi:hypothetical protein
LSTTCFPILPLVLSVEVAVFHTSAASVPKVDNDRVGFVHTSAAKVPNDVNVLPEYAQTLAGSEVIILPIDVEALLIAVLVFPLMTAAKLDDAVPILLSVFALTADVTPDV